MNLKAAFEAHDWAMTREAYDSMVARASPNNKPVALKTNVTTDDTYQIFISGPIVSDHDLFSIMFGATSSTDIIAGIAEGQKHARIEKIYDSGGGQVKGGDKVVEAIRASGVPISSRVDGTCASQAFLYASSVLDKGKPANRFTASENSHLGSIGVQAVIYRDPNEEVIRSENAPLKNSTESVQKSVNDTEAKFLNQLAENFSRDKSEIIQNFGQGLVFTAEEALERQMIQAIEDPPAAPVANQTTNKGKEMSKETSQAGAEITVTAEDIALREQAAAAKALDDYKAEQARLEAEAETARLKAEAEAEKRKKAILESEAGKANPTKAAELVADADYTAELAVKTLAMLPPEGSDEKTDFHADLDKQPENKVGQSFSESSVSAEDKDDAYLYGLVSGYVDKTFGEDSARAQELNSYAELAFAEDKKDKRIFK